jgi:hypothetical protein
VLWQSLSLRLRRPRRLPFDLGARKGGAFWSVLFWRSKLESTGGQYVYNWGLEGIGLLGCGDAGGHGLSN